MYVFFRIARLQSKCLNYYKLGVTYAIFDILKKTDWMKFRTSADKICCMLTILLCILWKYSGPNLEI